MATNSVPTQLSAVALVTDVSAARCVVSWFLFIAFPLRCDRIRQCGARLIIVRSLHTPCNQGFGGTRAPQPQGRR